jgi:hypothetical protein
MNVGDTHDALAEKLLAANRQDNDNGVARIYKEGKASKS